MENEVWRTEKILSFLEKKKTEKKLYFRNQYAKENEALKKEFNERLTNVQKKLMKQSSKERTKVIDGYEITYRSIIMLIEKDGFEIHGKKIEPLTTAMKSLKEKLHCNDYMIDSDYDRIVSEIMISGINEKVIEMIRSFINFGWARFW
jgi:hypothetical protein